MIKTKLKATHYRISSSVVLVANKVIDACMEWIEARNSAISTREIIDIVISVIEDQQAKATEE
jgi:hypothetical protein